MTDFKFAKECSEKKIKFFGCDSYFTKTGKIINERQGYGAVSYPNPSEEELSKRLPSTICRYDINYYFFIYYDTELSYYYIIYRNDIRGDLIMETGKTTKECYQKAILKLNDMELLK